jgi:hypothetical protein
VNVRSIREWREQQERDAAHALVGGVDRQRVGQGAHADAAFGEVMHEVEDLAQVAAEPVEGVQNDRGQTHAVDGAGKAAVRRSAGTKLGTVS